METQNVLFALAGELGLSLESPPNQADLIEARQAFSFSKDDLAALKYPSIPASTVADKVGYAIFPDAGTGNHGNWLWSWNLAIPASSQNAEAATNTASAVNRGAGSGVTGLFHQKTSLASESLSAQTQTATLVTRAPSWFFL